MNPTNTQDKIRSWESGRVYGLDILRCYCIIMVMWVHSVTGLLPNEWNRILMIIVNIDPIGPFYVLSGYLIGLMLLRKVEAGKFGTQGLIKFFRERFLRTFPLYFFMLVLYLLLSAELYDHFSKRAAWPYFLFLQNFSAYKIYFFEESWSLPIEIWFYIIAACAIMVINKIRPSKSSVLWVGIGMIIASVLLRAYKYQLNPPQDMYDWYYRFRAIVTASLDYPAYGLVGAYLHVTYKKYWERYKWPLFIFSIASMLIAYVLVVATNLRGITTLPWSLFFNMVCSVITLMCLPLLTSISTGKGWIYKAISYISLRSYSLYLIHSTLIINMLFNTVIHNKLKALQVEKGTGLSILFFIIFWIIVFPIANLSYRYIEVPFMNMRKYKSGPRTLILSLIRRKN